MHRRTFLRSSFAAAAGVAASGGAPLFARAALHDAAYHRDVVAITGDGREVTLTDAMLKELAGALRGRLLLSGDPGYDDARRILNPSFDRHPAVIVQATGAADVSTAVQFAASHGGLLTAVKCGGHSLSGKSTCDRGMMIDLSSYRSVRVDPAARRAWVTGGSLLGAVDHETMAHGLVTPLGTVSHTGVGGLVTGGGFGRLARRFGLSIDNVRSVDVVTADGTLRHADAQQEPDLFWGVRGGGGNFGVVTHFEFELHPLDQHVLGGRIMFPLDRFREVLTAYAEVAPMAPDDVQIDCAVQIPPGGAPGLAGFAVCYSGPPSGVDAVLAPLRRLGGATVDAIEPIAYPALQRSSDIDDPRAVAMYVKSGFINEMSPALVRALVDNLEGHPGRTTQLLFQQSGGAIGRVSPAATAFARRDAMALMLCLVGWRHGDDPAGHIGWIRDFWPAVESYTDGFYVNDLDVERGEEEVRATYGANARRLVAVKKQYDPSNLFRLNANIPPAL